MKKRLFKHCLLFITLFVGKISFTMEQPDTIPTMLNSTFSDEIIIFNEINKIIIEHENTQEAQTEEEKSLLGNIAIEYLAAGYQVDAIGIWLPGLPLTKKYLYTFNVNDCTVQFKKTVDNNDIHITHLRTFYNKIHFSNLFKNSLLCGGGILSICLYGAKIAQYAIDNLQDNSSLFSQKKLLPLSIAALFSATIVGLSSYVINKNLDEINKNIKGLCHVNSKNFYTELKSLADYITINDTEADAALFYTRTLREQIATTCSTQLNNHITNHN